MAGNCFGPFFLDVASYRLMRDDAPVALSPKLIDLLLYLVARPSALATKDDLLKALWPDVIVTDNALTQAVSELRQALGDDHRSAEVRRELDAARKDVAALQRSERLVDAAMMRAGERVVSGHPDEAIQVLGQLLVEAPAGSAGWIIPIEPLFEPLRTRPAFRQVLQTLATRAG